MLEKIGWVKTSEQLPKNTKYSNPRINFDGKYWYVSVGIDEKRTVSELTGDVLGIDLGIKDLAIVSTGKVYKNINKTGIVRKIEKRLRRL
ncbi:hypothetical protein [Enterococcus gilvus]|uniref:hypothetical protein n=1 Tax=Enterococcus gilvus TaxID=160453 RepID=UPI0028D28CAC|nr:hypothetical protein [Enterococcus gilvus]